MEEVGTQVASPIFLHKTLAGRFCDSHPVAKKRSLPFQGASFHHHHHQQLQQQHHRLPSGFENGRDNWNPKQWEWDSSRFVAKPLESDVLCLGDPAISVNTNVSKRNSVGDGKELDESLLLKLGGAAGAAINSVEEPIARPNKKVRSGSPGNGGGGSGGGGNYPMCQVDNCKEDLSTAKDYHRRHKVCEVHSKATKALVGKQMQRFCQQCSRFHPLSEFDEGKRSCRRRLAGHNRRRRKTQPEDVTSQLLLPGNRDKAGNGGDMDIVNLLTVLAHNQGNIEDRSTTCPLLPNKDQLIQILNKINSLPLPVDLAAKLPVSGNLNRIVPDKVVSENQNRLNGNGNPCSSTMDLLAVLSAKPATPAPDARVTVSQRSSQGSDTDRTNSDCLDQGTFLNLHNGPGVKFPSVGGGERSSTSFHSPVEDSDCQVMDAPGNLPLQLFSSSPENDSPPKLASSRKYFSSDSSNPMEERSPSSSPPVVQRLFPTHASREMLKPETMSTSGEVTANGKGSRSRGCIPSLELFGGSNPVADNGSIQSSPYRAGYTSSSGSDQSPSSLNSDPQDRTGRIIFKLFDKDPSHLPGTLRTQIYNWLSHSPSEMEGYIRPGCVVLSIYVSLSSSAWEQLEAKFRRHVNSLVQDPSTDFWRNGRFLVHTDRHLASHKDGRVHLCKSLRAWSSPELISVSPLAVVGGKETSLRLKGRNLRTSGTKIHCTHTSGNTLKEVPGSASQDDAYDEISLGSFTVHQPSVLGRCFIEVENGFRGTSFPVIIADATICKELRLLEADFDESVRVHDTATEDRAHEIRRPTSREEMLHFLNELGWLFQRKGVGSMLGAPNYGLSRFKFLFIFAAERDFCDLVKTLLDILLERNLGTDELSRESLEMLSEINLLNRAVKRRCKTMVDLLIHYSIFGINNTSRKYVFPPNLDGPGGITPLHLAACTASSDDLVDTLTSDPQEIGLQCWNSLRDANGYSPYAYAEMRNNHSYNTLVARKLADRIAGQISLSISNEIELQTSTVNSNQQGPSYQGQKSCSRCAVVAARYHRRIPGSQGLLHRPYIHSMLAIAAVCVCVCLFLRGAPDIGSVAPFKWENLSYGPI